MNMVKLLSLIFAGLLGAGCEEVGKQPKVPEVSDQSPREETFVDPQLKALEKAKGVEGMLNDSDLERRKIMEKEGG